MLKFELTEAEFQALCGLLDAGVRSVGLRSVKDAAVLLSKLEAAQSNAGKTPARRPDEEAQTAETE